MTMAQDETSAHGYTLHEEDILRATRQYDIEVVYEAPLRSRGLVSLGDAFSRCRHLTVLDVSRNALVSLNGLHTLAATLTTLNAAENAIIDIDDLSRCAQLQRVFLEGNQLQTRAAIEPLSRLARLEEVYFRREASLDDRSPPTILDNPVCADRASYAQMLDELFSHVRWVDGVRFRETVALPNGVTPVGAHASRVAAAREVSEKNMVAIANEALRTTDTEVEFKNLLNS